MLVGQPDKRYLVHAQCPVAYKTNLLPLVKQVKPSARVAETHINKAVYEMLFSL